VIVVAGTVRVRPERRAEAIQAALEMAGATRAEAGCLTYQFHVSLEDPNTFFIFEEWETDEALARHFQTAHMKAFQQRIPNFIGGEARIKRYAVSSAAPM
jgi:quinol monooxygenase YgiN